MIGLHQKDNDILYFVRGHEPIGVHLKQIADATGISIQNTYRYTQKLLKKGLLHRDKRKLFHLTEEADAKLSNQDMWEGKSKESVDEDKIQANRSAAQQDSLDKINFGILRALSMNARMPLENIGRLVGLKKTAVYHRIRNLEEYPGISYMAEIDVEKLGYTEFLLFIKFRGRRPTRRQAESVFAKDARVQFAAITEGEYHIMAYALAKNNDDASDLMFKLMGGAMQDLDAEWYLVPFKGFYGYAPLRDEFFDIIEEEGMWQRSKDQPRKPPNALGMEEYTVLRELNTNGKAEFKEISERYKLKTQSANYYYRRLVDEGIIKRITITMNKLPLKYMAVLIAAVTNRAKFQKTRTDLLSEVIRESDNYANTYLLVGDTQNPNGVVFMAPILSDNSIESAKEEILAKIDGIEVKTSIMTDVLVGRTCLRNYDNEYTVQYEMIEEAKLEKQK